LIKREAKSLFDLVLDGLKDLAKQTKADGTKFKKPQNGVRFSLKPTPGSKMN
jgi:hypothetical protein